MPTRSVGEGKQARNSDHGRQHDAPKTIRKQAKAALLLIGRPGVHKALLYHPGWKVHLEGTYGPRGTLQHSMRMRVCVYYALLHPFAGRGQQQQHTVRLTYILHVF